MAGPAISTAEFVGRRGELDELTRAMAAPPAIALVEGEAGVGKSRLVREFLVSTTGALVASCPPVPEPYTLGPLVDALRSATDQVASLRLSALAGALRPLFPEWDAVLPPTPEPAEDATAARHRVFRALGELLDGLGVRLVVVEDVHWADGATLEFLLYLVRQDGPRPGLVVSYRPDDVPPDSLLLALSARLPAGALRLALAPLDLDATAGLVSSMLAGDRISGGFAALLYEHTEGLPLAVEESVRLMYDRGDLVRRGGRWARRHLDRIEVPPSVRDAVLERARRLSPDGWTLLAAAAVLVEPCVPDVLVEVSGLAVERAAGALVEALTCGLLVEGTHGQVSFRHVLAGRAVHEAVPAPIRRAMHGRAGRSLHGTSPQLARHFRESGDTAEWLRHAERAADLALASGDEATAGSLLRDLVVNGEWPALHTARLIEKMPFWSFAGSEHFRRVAVAVRSRLERGGFDPRDEAVLRFQFARVLLKMEDLAAGRAELERAIPDLGHDPVEAADAMLQLGWPRGSDPASVHVEWLQRAAALDAKVPPGDRLRLIQTRVSALLLLGEESGWREADRIPDEARTVQDRQVVTAGHLNVGDMARIWGRYPEVSRRLATALRLAEQYGHIHIRNVVLATQAHLDWLTGTWDGLGERVDALAGNDGMPVTGLEPVLVRGLLAAARGRHDAAVRDFEQVLAGLRTHGAVEHIAEVAAGLARVRLHQGRLDDALAITDEPLRTIAAKRTWLWATDLGPVRVQALLAAGRPTEARDLISAFGQGIGCRDAPGPQAGLTLCKAAFAEAAGKPDAAELFARAAAAWQRLPRPYEAALARERQARCLIAAGDEATGVDLLSEVLAEVTALGATGDAERMAHELRRHGVAVPRAWRGGRHGYGDQLSPRELDVVELVATGQTNGEIAKALSRSPKTVATQLRSAMRKLGVSSRTALTARVIQAGLLDQS